MAAKRGYTYPAPSSAQFNQQKILTDSQENGVKAIPVTDFAKSQYEIQQAESESDIVGVEIVDKKIKITGTKRASDFASFENLEKVKQGDLNDNSIVSKKLSKIDSEVKDFETSDFILYENKFVGGQNADRTMALVNNSNFDVYKVDLDFVKSFIKFPYNSGVSGQALILADAENKIVVRLSAAQIPTTAENWVSVVDGKIVINKERALSRSSLASCVVVTMAKTDKGINADLSYVIPLHEMLWLDYKKDVKESAAEFGIDDAKLVFQPRIDWIGGKQFLCYYENILLNKMLNQCFVLPKQDNNNENFFDGVWQWDVPTVSSVTRNYRQVNLYENSLNKAKTYSFDLYVHPATTANGNYKVMLLGDSKTALGTLPAKIKSNFDADANTNIEFIGSLSSGGVANEGRTGWTANNYCRSESYNGYSNPFLNNGAFDFSHYMTTQGFSGVDCVAILLGTNDASSNLAHEAIIAYYDEMIASIKAYNNNVKIVIGLAENMCQLKFKYTLNKNRILGFVSSLITKYGNKRNDKIFLCPTYISQNLYTDYNFTEVNESRVSTDMVKRVTDHVHQNANGYAKNADVIYCAIKCALGS